MWILFAVSLNVLAARPDGVMDFATKDIGHYATLHECDRVKYGAYYNDMKEKAYRCEYVANKVQVR